MGITYGKPVDKYDDYCVLMLGYPASGKTSLARKFVKNEFSRTHELPPKCRYEEFICSKNIRVRFFEHPEGVNFNAYRKLVYGSFNGAMVVFDVRDRQSFEALDKIITNFQTLGGSEVPLFVLGNKTDEDPTEPRVVSEEEALHFCEMKDIPYYEASALTGSGINDAFPNMINLMFNKRMFSK